jgi:hypothetical protein
VLRLGSAHDHATVSPRWLQVSGGSAYGSDVIAGERVGEGRYGMPREWLKEITDPERLRDLRSALKPVLEDAYDFSLDWIADKGWAVIPRPDRINRRDAEWIAAAASELGYDSCDAISTEYETGAGIAYTVPMTPRGIAVFSSDSIGAFALFPQDLAFMILSMGDLHFLAAGPRDFVRRAVGCSFRTARRVFLKEQMSLKSWEPRTWQKMTTVSKRYALCEGKSGVAGPGDPVLDLLSQGKIPEPSRDALRSIEKVPYSDDLRALRSKIVPMVDSRCRVRVEALNERGWVAMPVNADMNDMDAEWIAQAAKDLGCTYCYAIPCRGNQDMPVYKASMKQDVVLAFYGMFYLQNYLLCPPELEFAIIGESRHHFVVMGTTSFVESAVGATLETAADALAYLDKYTMCPPTDSLPDDSEIEEVDDLIIRFELYKLMPDFPVRRK